MCGDTGKIAQRVWAPLLAALAVPLERAPEVSVLEKATVGEDNDSTAYLCLKGMRYIIRIAALMGMEVVRHAFMTAISKYAVLSQVTSVVKMDDKAQMSTSSQPSLEVRKIIDRQTGSRSISSN